MHPLFKSLFFLPLALIFASCSSSFYAPNVHNVPAIGEVNEFAFSASRTAYDRTFSSDLQAAFSPVENWAFMLNASFFERRKSDSASFDEYGMAGNFYEAAVGYYKPLGGYGLLDIYGGYGRLSNGSTDFNEVYHASFDYNRFFVQSSIGIKYDIIDIIFSLRLNHLQFRNLSYDSIPPPSYYDGRVLTSNKNFMMVEPAFTFRVGYRYLKLQTQLVNSYNFSPSGFPHDRIGFNIGLIFNFKPSYLKKDPTDDF